MPPSKSRSSPPTSANWRIQIKQRQLVSQTSSILLQRRNWAPLLHSLPLSSKLLTPPLFLQILLKTKTHPQISLSFFNWTTTNLNFKPDLRAQCYLLQLSLRSGLSNPANDIMDSILQDRHPASFVGETMVRACRGNKDSNFSALDYLLESYSRRGLFLEGLELFKRMRVNGLSPSVDACNKVLDVLLGKNETRLGWCFYGAMIRDGLLPDKVTWSVIARILYKDRKFENIMTFLDMGIGNSVMYSAVVEGYSKRGDFGAAFDRLDEMRGRKLQAGFSIYSSLLDGACKHGNSEVVDRVTGLMVEKGLLLKSPLLECDSVIQKLCDLGKVDAAMMYFRRALDEKIGLQKATYGCMLKALSKEGRVDEAIGLYHVIVEKGVAIKIGTCSVFADLLCRENYHAEGYKILKEIIERGCSPCSSSLSKFISSQCSQHGWREVEDLLNVIIEKELLLDSLCCCSLVEHYCSSGQIDKAVALHGKMKKLRASLDLATYNILLDGLVKEGRVHDAAGVFDYMTELKLLDSKSFTTIICGLCRVRELRKAMKLHDEMLKMGLKPDKATYTGLILEFNQ